MTDNDVEATSTASAEAPMDAKARFKAALDAKNAKAKAKSGGADDETGQPLMKGSETSGPSQRMFRRKAGG
jgi:hypothetical protein